MKFFQHVLAEPKNLYNFIEANLLSIAKFIRLEIDCDIGVSSTKCTKPSRLAKLNCFEVKME